MNVPSLPRDVSVYLDNVLGIMQQNAIYRNQVNWNVLRAQMYERAQNAQTSSDTYAAIQYALTQLGDHHSYFLPPDRVTKLRSATVIDNPPPKGEILESRVGYVLVPKFSSYDTDQINNSATLLQEIIRGLDAQNPRGWIVDLRGNEGGNMWSMLAGTGSILGEGRVGAFIYPDGHAKNWYYANGEARVETWIQAKVKGEPYQLKMASPPVAVLTNRSTASSGEAIVVAFKGRPNTRSFGEGTRGLSTSNASLALNDGAMLVLTVAVFADRTGQKYGGVIIPDEVVDTMSYERDRVLDTAVKWFCQTASA